jgi:hypothetical protein
VDVPLPFERPATAVVPEVEAEAEFTSGGVVLEVVTLAPLVPVVVEAVTDVSTVDNMV